MNATTLRSYADSMKKAICKVISGELNPADSGMYLSAVMTDLDKIVDDAEKSEGKAATRETRNLYRDDLRRLCIKNNWYTRGTNEEYEKMLTFVDACDNVTTADIVKIATDIICHSDTEYPTSSICFEIAKICNSIFE